LLGVKGGGRAVFEGLEGAIGSWCPGTSSKCREKMMASKREKAQTAVLSSGETEGSIMAKHSGQPGGNSPKLQNQSLIRCVA